MKRPVKKWACNYKNVQRLGEALCGILPKKLPKRKSLSSVDQVTALCWDAVMQTINFTAVTAVHLLPLVGHKRLSGKLADRSLIQISLCGWKETLTPSFSAAI